jgi:hypothetical protein
VTPHPCTQADPGHRDAAPGSPALVDQMSEHSFPASDPPAVWTWDVAPQPSTSVKRYPDREVKPPTIAP